MAKNINILPPNIANALSLEIGLIVDELFVPATYCKVGFKSHAEFSVAVNRAVWAGSEGRVVESNEIFEEEA